MVEFLSMVVTVQLLVYKQMDDLWTVPGEEHNLKIWKSEDELFFNSIDPILYYHELQIKEFLNSIIHDRDAMISAEDGRKTVELFTAVYKSQQSGKVIKFPIK